MPVPGLAPDPGQRVLHCHVNWVKTHLHNISLRCVEGDKTIFNVGMFLIRKDFEVAARWCVPNTMTHTASYIEVCMTRARNNMCLATSLWAANRRGCYRRLANPEVP